MHRFVDRGVTIFVAGLTKKREDLEWIVDIVNKEHKKCERCNHQGMCYDNEGVLFFIEGIRKCKERSALFHLFYELKHEGVIIAESPFLIRKEGKKWMLKKMV